MLFAPPSVRKGVLPRMLSEILETRVMVKTSMKRAGPSQRNLQVAIPPDIDPRLMHSAAILCSVARSAGR